ncbi:MAG: hypothetical protein ACHREM_20000 [Polyangiales bacterium]
MASPHQPLLDALRTFRTSWPRRGWSFDGRVQCVASTFDAEFAPQAKLLIETVLPHVWTERTLATASPLIARVASRTGGIRSTQMIFGADPIGHVTAYGLWWPWEEGRTISLRIGVEGGSSNDVNDLCTVFGAEQ